MKHILISADLGEVRKTLALGAFVGVASNPLLVPKEACRPSRCGGGSSVSSPIRYLSKSAAAGVAAIRSPVAWKIRSNPIFDAAVQTSHADDVTAFGEHAHSAVKRGA